MNTTYDFHIHTVLCGHADERQQVPAIVARAEKMGLEAIAITEHIGQAEDMAQIQKIREELKNLNPSCRVMVGGEVDADRCHVDGRLAVVKNLDQLDLVIGTIHYLPGTDVMPHCQETPNILPEKILERWRSTLLGLVCNPAVNTLAHPGAMIANALPNDDWSNDVLAFFEEAAKLSVTHQTAWEINNLICHKLTIRQQESYWKIIQLAQDAGVQLVYGSDAHRPEDIGATDFVDSVVAKLSNTVLFREPVYKTQPTNVGLFSS